MTPTLKRGQWYVYFWHRGNTRAVRAVDPELVAAHREALGRGRCWRFPAEIHYRGSGISRAYRTRC